jgi:polyisoprenoid-binding protein YceI
VLENLIKAPNFLDVEKYPTAKLVINKVLPNPVVGTSTGKYIVDAKLTVKDVTEFVSFPITLTEEEGRLVGHSSFAINKALWGIKSPDNKPVKDAVSIDLHVEAVR